MAGELGGLLCSSPSNFILNLAVNYRKEFSGIRLCFSSLRNMQMARKTWSCSPDFSCVWDLEIKNMSNCVCLGKKQISSEKSAMRTQKRKLRPLAGGTK